MARTIEVYAEPSSGRFGAMTTLTEQQSVALPELDLSWPVAELLV